MQKSDVIISLLQKLQDHWQPAQGLLLVVQNWSVNDAFIDTLFALIESSINLTKDHSLREKFQKSKHIIQKIKQQEEVIKQQESDELDKILGQI